LTALTDSFILYQIGRYDVKGKQYLKTGDKYYAADIGLRYALLGTKKADMGHILENVVFLELLRRGYEIYIGKVNNTEGEVSDLKRAYCLYRVSTKGQVEKDDIPMQKTACHEFAERNGWTVLKEFSEKGVSGFKVAAQNRDAIQDLKTAAERHEFEILLVYMFDRLGRRQNETPFVVEWFVGQGIEVWSTQEGQQSFENDVDYVYPFSLPLHGL